MPVDVSEHKDFHVSPRSSEASPSQMPSQAPSPRPGQDCTRWRLDVGGLSLQATVPEGWQLVETDPAYDGFLGLAPPGSHDCPSDVAVELTLEPPRLSQAATFEELPRVFDTEETWQVRRDGDDLLLRLSIPAPLPRGPAPTESASPITRSDYLWLARFAADPARCRRITVHCGRQLCHGDVEAPSTQRGLLQNPLHYPLDQLLLDFLLPSHGGFVCHAAGLFHCGRAILCAGKSGAGKTTISRLAATHAHLEVLSDDRVVLRQDSAGPRLYGTPWPGEGRMAVPASAPLAALVFLRHADEGAPHDTLTPLSPAQALDRLLPVSSILWFDGVRMEAALDVCAELVATVPAYELSFRPEPSALDLLEPLFRDPSHTRER